MAKDKTKEVADIAQDKGEEMKEAGALCMKKKPSTILKDTGEKVEVVKEAAEKELDVEEKMVPVQRRRWFQPPLQL